MLAPRERERLLTAMVGVYTDPDDGTGEPVRGEAPDASIFADAFTESLNDAEEEFVHAVRKALEKIATAVSGTAIGSATVAALGGAELTTRALIAAGEADLLPRLLPGFAYLVSLPGLGEPQAARMAERVRALVEQDEKEDGGDDDGRRA